LSVPLVRCDDPAFNFSIKQEDIDDPAFNVRIKQENIEFNGFIKVEPIDETDHHNDSQLFQERYLFIGIKQARPCYNRQQHYNHYDNV